jgi:FAD synthetase
MLKQNKKIVMIFGTFDILHPGHENFFEQARLKGDYLIVVVARDKNVFKNKGRVPKYNEKERLEFVRKTGLADKITLGNVNDQYLIIKKYQPDIICIGYDQKVNLEELRKKIKEYNLSTKIFKLKSYYPEKYKSSILKKRL